MYNLKSTNLVKCYQNISSSVQKVKQINQCYFTMNFIVGLVHSSMSV
jgi:hypothetical protein